MPRDGGATKERILEAAQDLVLENGFSATSIDMVIAKTGITKGAFFYHYKSKAALARALVERYARSDHGILMENLARAEKLSRDPLQQVLIFIGLYEEMAEALTEPYPGCLFASYCYESQQFEQDIKSVISDSFLEWRNRLSVKFAAVIERYPPRLPVDAAGLADFMVTTFEGAFVMSKTLQDAKIVAQHLAHYKNYIELLFGDTQAGTPSAPTPP